MPGATQIFGGPRYQARKDHREVAIDILPYLRGRVSVSKRMIGTFSALPEVLTFINAQEAQKFAFLGTSCPDHFVRTKIRPMYVPWNPEDDLQSLRKAIDEALAQYRKDYAHYYQQHAKPEDPAMRDASPTVVLIPGIGMFSFGKSKTESRITGEFYVNAIHVMEGASALRLAHRLRFCRKRVRRRRALCSRSIATTSRCRPRRHFVLNTGRSKRPSSAASRRRRNSAATSCSWLAEAVASDEKWFAWAQGEERMWWSPIVIWQAQRNRPNW